MSTHNIGFYEDLTKIIFELSSNIQLISSAALGLIVENMPAEDAVRTANSANPDQTAPLKSRSTLFAQAYLSEN